MDFTKELNPTSVFEILNSETFYWIKDGKIYFRNEPVKGADIESFRFYAGSFAKDKKHCYRVGRRLKNADPQTFQALNYTFFKDEKQVWVLGGKIKDADSKTFAVCDDGCFKSGSICLPPGFGKDKEQVFYYDFDGIANWVKKANPETFTSLQDGYFGKYDKFVFFGRAVIPSANLRSWRKIGGHFSKDDSKIFYMNRPIKTVDHATFEVVNVKIAHLAKDKNNYYWNDNIISRDRFLELNR